MASFLDNFFDAFFESTDAPRQNQRLSRNVIMQSTAANKGNDGHSFEGGIELEEDVTPAPITEARDGGEFILAVREPNLQGP